MASSEAILADLFQAMQERDTPMTPDEFARQLDKSTKKHKSKSEKKAKKSSKKSKKKHRRHSPERSTSPVSRKRSGGDSNGKVVSPKQRRVTSPPLLPPVVEVKTPKPAFVSVGFMPVLSADDSAPSTSKGSASPPSPGRSPSPDHGAVDTMLSKLIADRQPGECLAVLPHCADACSTTAADEDVYEPEALPNDDTNKQFRPKSKTTLARLGMFEDADVEEVVNARRPLPAVKDDPSTAPDPSAVVAAARRRIEQQALLFPKKKSMPPPSKNSAKEVKAEKKVEKSSAHAPKTSDRKDEHVSRRDKSVKENGGSHTSGDKRRRSRTPSKRRRSRSTDKRRRSRSPRRRSPSERYNRGANGRAQADGRRSRSPRADKDRRRHRQTSAEKEAADRLEFAKRRTADMITTGVMHRFHPGIKSNQMALLKYGNQPKNNHISYCRRLARKERREEAIENGGTGSDVSDDTEDECERKRDRRDEGKALHLNLLDM